MLIVCTASASAAVVNVRVAHLPRASARLVETLRAVKASDGTVATVTTAAARRRISLGRGNGTITPNGRVNFEVTLDDTGAIVAIVHASGTAKDLHGVVTAPGKSGEVAEGFDSVEHGYFGAWARGSRFTLVAMPSRGSHFSHWGGACSGRSTTCTLTVAPRLDATAYFAEDLWTLTIVNHNPKGERSPASASAVESGKPHARA